jgi:hypothetical protein
MRAHFVDEDFSHELDLRLNYHAPEPLLLLYVVIHVGMGVGPGPTHPGATSKYSSTARYSQPNSLRQIVIPWARNELPASKLSANRESRGSNRRVKYWIVHELGKLEATSMYVRRYVVE